MKVALRGEDSYFDMGFYTYYYPAGEIGVELDVPLPPEIDIALQNIRKELEKADYLRGIIDTSGHGTDLGIVTRISQGKDIGTEENRITSAHVVARVSFGPGPEYVGVSKGSWNSKEYGRLHINVYSARTFFPRDRSLLSEETANQEVCRVSNEAHISLRWINGKFDDWSNIDDFQRDAQIIEEGIEVGGEPKLFNNKRTSYCRFNIERVLDEKEVELYKETLKQEGFRESLVPKTLTLRERLDELLAEQEQKHTYEMKARVFKRMFRCVGGADYIPQVGYAPVLDLLSRFGDVKGHDAMRIQRMSPQEGLEYLFGKVLPAMKKFAYY